MPNVSARKTELPPHLAPLLGDTPYLDVLGTGGNPWPIPDTWLENVQQGIKRLAEDPRSAAFYNGELAVGIDIVKSKGFSTTAVADDIRARLEER